MTVRGSEGGVVGQILTFIPHLLQTPEELILDRGHSGTRAIATRVLPGIGPGARKGVLVAGSASTSPAIGPQIAECHCIRTSIVVCVVVKPGFGHSRVCLTVREPQCSVAILVDPVNAGVL